MPYLRPYAEWSNLRKPWLLRLLFLPPCLIDLVGFY